MNKPIHSYSLEEFQQLNTVIYGATNGQEYSDMQMLLRITQSIGKVSKSFRQNNLINRAKYLCMTFSWALAFANKHDLVLADEIWKYFPDICPYCNSGVCKGVAFDGRRMVITQSRPRPEPLTLKFVQRMFASIYSHNTLLDSIIHLHEEGAEVTEALENFMSTHVIELKPKIALELIDVIANICAVATCSGIDLAVEMEKQFSAGCCECHKTPCGCGYVVANSVTLEELLRKKT